MGCSRSGLKNWFPSAVSSSGAVSPPARAMDSTTPVITPALAVGRTTRMIVFQRYPEGEAGFAKRVGHQAQSLLHRARDDGDHDDGKRHPASQAVVLADHVAHQPGP